MSTHHMISTPRHRPHYPPPIPQNHPPLLSLPNPLLNRILSHLSTHSLSQIHSTCHHLNILSARPLYRIIYLHPDRFMALVESLARNAHLREMVEVLTIHDHHTVDTDYADALARVVALLGNMRMLRIKGCYTRTLEGVVPGGPAQEIPGWSNVYAPVLNSPFLTRLEYCEISLSACEIWPMSTRENIFLHPTLRKLSILGASIPSFPRYNQTLHGTTNLQDLALLCCDISASTVSKLVSLPRALRRFTMAGARQLGDGEFTDTRHERYFAALHVQAASLKVLEMGLWNFKKGHGAPIDLRAFTVLEQFTLTPLMLPPDEGQGHFHYLTPILQHGFPATLKNIVLFHLHHETFHIVERIILAQLVRMFEAGGLPNLRTVTLATPVFTDRYAGMDLGVPVDWRRVFGGRVRVSRREVTNMKRFPVDCQCSDYEMGKWVVWA
ncbi:hypothetical protein BJX70DRAFT_404494 [Aspergillus crustosus]